MAKHSTKATAHKGSRLCTTDDVSELGQALLRIADEFPTTFLTERDFYPLVGAYLYGRFPGVSMEHKVKSGAIDFRLGGMNPSVIELVVAPRALRDDADPGFRFPGHRAATQLYPTQNRSELKKLAGMPQSKAKKRYLLLLDFRAFDPTDLWVKYGNEARRIGLRNPVCVVHVSRKETQAHTLRRRGPN